MPLAARLTDLTTHGTPLAPGLGSPDVLIGSFPAWRTLLDLHACPAVSISGADGIGTVLMGSPTVWTNSQMACRVMDIVVEVPGLAMGPMNPIAMGCQNVEIGGPVATAVMVLGTLFVNFGGINIAGSPADVRTFMLMAASAAAATNAARVHFATIAGDSAHPITLVVGRSLPGVITDNFGTNEVDLNDLERFPATPRAAHPNETGQDEMITHFMVERHDAATKGSAFPAAHTAGIDAQNEMRSERGQPALTGQNFTGTKDAAGNDLATHDYADGTHQTVHIDNNDNIVGVDPP